MIKLHHLNNSRSQRIIWALKELDLDFEILFYQRDSVSYLAPASLRQVHPLGKSPILEDGGKKLAESAVIIDYLIRQYAPHMAPDVNSEDYLNYNYWMHYAEGSLMPYLVMSLVFDKIRNNPMPFFAKPIAKKIFNKAMSSFVSPNIETHLTYINEHLNGRCWFYGDSLSGVDFQMIFPLEAVYKAKLINSESHPNIVNYVKKIQSRSAYQDALAVSDENNYS